MKRVLSYLAVLLLCCCLLALPARAAGAEATFTGPGTVRAGDTVTLTLSLNGTDIYGASGTLSYDKSLLELTSTKQKIGNGWKVEFSGNDFVVYDDNLAKPISKNTALFTVSFKVKSSVAPGTVIKVSCVNLVASDGKKDDTIGTVSYSKTVAEPASADNSLKSLTVSNATISPAFAAGTTSYTAEVPFDVAKLTVKATAGDSAAKVSVNSPTLTPGGTTKVTVTVTAENGDKKVYTIAVKRAQDPNYVASANNDLAEITVEGFLLSPVFSAENTSYVIWLPYETEGVTVSGTPADSKASVRIEGGSGLIAGADNEIKVICVAEDGSEKVYTVIARRAAVHGSAVIEPTEPATEPTEPATEPGVPLEPAKGGGIPWWSLLIVGVLCLGGGVALGILADKKLLTKDE